MTIAPHCNEEDARQHALTRLQLAVDGSEPQLDAVVKLASAVFGCPVSYLSVLDRHRQRIKACVGMDGGETARENSFCAHTVLSDEVFVVPDALRDRRFETSPMVAAEPGIRFYAGAPLVTGAGQRVGALCIGDDKPRKAFSRRERRLLKDLAALAVDEMERRRDAFARASMMSFVDAADLSVVLLDPTGRIELASRSTCAMFGYAPDAMIGEQIETIVPERLRAAHRAGFARVFAGGQPRLSGKTIETTALRGDGAEFPIELSLSVWRSERGLGVGAVIRDISERRERDARLLRLANHDTLTGLVNRRRFEQLLAERFAKGERSTVLLLDLDGFKDVNDTLGHGVGDTLLQALGIRLPSVLPSAAVVARFGGDAFAVLLPLGDPREAHRCAHAVLSAFDEPFEIEGHTLQLAGSVGFALAPGHGDDPEELIASADFALYRAKKAGGRACFMFASEMRHASAARRATQDELLRALHGDELELHYQPQIRLSDGVMVGVEALLRWRHPVRGLLSPAAFMPALETSALTLPVGWWVLDEACRQIAAWRRAGLSNVRVGVNLFPSQFRAAALFSQVMDTLARHDVEPGLLELEMTETIVMQNEENGLAALLLLREEGVRVAFDDFGTGFASLSTLKRAPLTTLKIDRSFVQDLQTCPVNAAITRAMFSMGCDLGLETIAEGVETAEQEAALRTLGCTVGQGFLYAKAMRPEEVIGFEARRAGRSSVPAIAAGAAQAPRSDAGSSTPFSCGQRVSA